MNLSSALVLNTYSILLTIIVYIYSMRQTEKESLQNKLFINMLLITILLLIVDGLGRFDGKSDTIYPILNHFGNFMLYVMSATLPSLWLLYVHYQVYQDEEKTEKLFYPLVAINVFNVIFVIVSQYGRWFYYIDSENIYHRGPLFLLSTSFAVFLLVVSFVLIITNRDKIERRYFFSLMFFCVPPFLGVILQIVFYGIPLVLNSVIISMLIVFLSIQNHNIYTDYLTGINNRKRLEVYLKDKVSTSTEERTFSAIMLDLVDFKQINDTYGHNVGDEALQIAARLLNSCLRSNDFIARFGGDEFFIVLDVSENIELEIIVNRIKGILEKYNETSDQPYILDFSIGYAVYDSSSLMGVKDFQKKIDNLMYENKQIHKQHNKSYNKISLS